MGLGVFISITPTFPLQIFIAVALAFVLRGSKAAAAIGVWFCNPITIPFIYIGSYKVGMFLLGNSSNVCVNGESTFNLLDAGFKVACALIAGGAILGIIPGIATYFITYKAFEAIKSKKKKNELSKNL